MLVLVIGLIIKLLLILVLLLTLEGCIGVTLVGTGSLCCQNGFLVGCIPGFIGPVWLIIIGVGIVF